MYARAFRDGDYRLIPNEAFEVSWTRTDLVFNPAYAPGSVASQDATSAVGVPQGTPPPAANEQFPSEPNAPADRDWNNPTSATPIPISLSSSGSVPLLPANNKRNLLIIQNNSASGGATFWIAFGVQAVAGQCIGLAPGQSLTLDYICPRDAVYITITGAAGTTQGCAIEGAYSPNQALARNSAYGKAPPYQPPSAPAPVPTTPATVAWGYAPPPAPSYFGFGAKYIP